MISSISSDQFHHQLCLTFYDPMDWNKPGLPVDHELPEFTQTHVQLVMPADHLTLCHPLLLLPSIFPSTMVISSESVLCIKRPKYWSFSFNINPSKEHSGLIFFRMDWLDLRVVRGHSRGFSNTTVQKHQFFSAQLSL